MKKIILGIFIIFCPLRAGLYAADESLSLSDALERLGAEFYWDSLFQSGLLKIEGRSVFFYAGERGSKDFVLYDNANVLSLPSPWLEDGTLYFHKDFVESIYALSSIAAVPASVEETGNYKIAAIMIDPGHGGKDPGAEGSHVINGKNVKLTEKDIVLGVANELYVLLKNALPGKKILISRTTDKYLTLDERVKMANSVHLEEDEAIIYVSIHANASFNKNARGFEVWFLDPGHNRTVIDKSKAEEYKDVAAILNDILQEEFNHESRMLAASIQKRMIEGFGERLPARGIQAEDFFVIRKAIMPSILVELAFVINEADAAMLVNPADLKTFANSIYKGIMDYILKFEFTSGGLVSK